MLCGHTFFEPIEELDVVEELVEDPADLRMLIGSGRIDASLKKSDLK